MGFFNFFYEDRKWREFDGLYSNMIICYVFVEGCGDFMFFWSFCNIYMSCFFVVFLFCEFVYFMSVRLYFVGVMNNCVE